MDTDATLDRGARRTPYTFEFSGGNLALDFANTVSGRTRAEPVDHVGDAADLVDWGVQAGILTKAQERRLRGEAAGSGRAAAGVLGRARALRESIYELFSTIAAGERPPDAALETFNAFVPAALSRLRIARDGKGCSWRPLPGEDLEEVLHPVVRAGADLLTSPDAARVRECRSDTCAWLFLDRSKNGTRCWCDMKVCGNRAKARRHYDRGKRTARRGSAQRKTRAAGKEGS